MLEIPTIKNIHQAVFEAASATGRALDMGSWHTCETTHCRAGWVVHLAGEAGYALERATDTPFAALMIYKKSSEIPVKEPVFYIDNEKSIADMKRCAELEKQMEMKNDS